MKKKILSVLLLLAMLITAVPVMVAAEEAAEPAAQSEKAATTGDVHEWYADGLVALYSTFGTSNGVDLTNGTWANRVENGEAATMKAGFWQATGANSIGYRMTYSGFYADALGSGIVLPNSYAELDEFTVEAFANVIGVTDENGDRYVNDSATSANKYGIFKAGISAFRFDMLTALFFASYDTNANQALTTRWYLMNAPYAGSVPDTDGSDGTLAAITLADAERGWSVSASDAYKLNVMQVSRATDEDGTETYTLSYNRVAKASKQMTAEQRALIAAATSTEANRFQLFQGMPADVYSVRVYDHVLSSAEMLQNHAVDVLLYYGIAVPADFIAKEKVRDSILGIAGTFDLVLDASEKAAIKAELQADVNNTVENQALIGLYAAGENLTSFFTTFIDGMVDVAAGTWVDLMGGAVATLETPSRWFVNADGSFGYNVYAGYVNGDTTAMEGNVNTDRAAIAALGNVPTANHAYYKNSALNFGLAKLPTEDFTVEYMAMYRPFLVADAAKSTADKIVYATDANGDLIEAYDLFGKTPGTTDYGSPLQRSMDTLGHFTVVTQMVDGSSGWGSSVRGTQHYMYKLHAWGTAAQRNWLGNSSWGATSGLAVKNDPYKQNDVINLYTITLDESVDAEGTLSGNFGLYRNASLYNQSNGVITWSDTAPDKTYTGEWSTNAAFYLSAGQPTDFYAVRVYDKVLTNEEKLQNLAIDTLLYYGIDYPTTLFEEYDGYTPEMFYEEITAYSLATDASEKAAVKAQLCTLIENMAKRNPASSLYVQSELTSLFTAFDGEADIMINSTGANKVWQNRVLGAGDATFKGGAIWTVGESGGVSKTYIRGTMTDGTYSATNANNTSITADYSLYFGLELLPKDDYTVEYLAYFPPLYAEDATTGEKVAHYTSGYTESGYAVDKIGFVEFDSVYPGGAFDSMNNYLRGRIAPKACSAWGGDNGGSTYGFGGTGFRIDNRDSLKVDTYAVSRDETVTRDENGTVTKVSADYTTYYNTAEKFHLVDFSTEYAGAKQGSYVSGVGYKNGQYYLYDDDTTFYLSKTAGATFYAVRVYSRELTADERAQNRMADVLYYYGITLTDAQRADAELLARLRTLAKSASMATDASAKAAEKAALLAEIAAFDTADYMDDIYVTDGLTAHYTTFLPGQYSLSSGTWTDLVGGKTASLGVKSFWSAGEFGGVGFNVFYGTTAEDGSYTTTSSYNNTNYDGLKLQFGIAQLTPDDSTVEYLAMYKPIYVADATGAPLTVDGEKVEAYDAFDGALPSGWLSSVGKAVDNVGWYSSYTNRIDGVCTVYSSYGRGNVFWVFDNPTWYAGRNGHRLTMMKKGDAYQTNGMIRTYDIRLDETLSVAEDGTRTTTATFGIFRDAAEYWTIGATTASTGADAYYDADTAFKSNATFTLSHARPTDFFAVRVYDRAISTEEMAQNRGADLMLYYGIEITDGIAGCPTVLASAQEGIAFATDASEIAANKAALIDALAGLKTEVTVSVSGATATLDTYGDTLILPETYNGKLALAWRVSGIEGTVSSGETVDVTGDTVLEPLLFTLPKTNIKTTVRATETESDLGVRFTATIYRDEYMNLIELYGIDSLRLGMLITPDAYVQMAGGVFTRDALRAMVDAKSGTSGAAYINITATKFYTVDDEILTIAGTVYSFKETTQKKNPAFAAIAYIDVDENRDGIVDFTLYGNYNPIASTTVTAAMNRALANATNTQKGWIDNLLKQFGA